MVISDQVTAAGHGLTRDIWQPIFPAGEKNMTFADLLLANWQENVDAGLTAAARIDFRSRKAVG